LKVDSCIMEQVPPGRGCLRDVHRWGRKGDRADRVNVPATAAVHCWPLKLETRTLNGTQGLHRSARHRKVPQGEKKKAGRSSRLYAVLEARGQSILSAFMIGRFSRMPKRTRRASQPITSIDRTLLNHTHAAALLVLLNGWSQRILWHWIFKPCQQSRNFACFSIRHVEHGGCPKREDYCCPVRTLQSLEHLREPRAKLP